MGLTDGKCQMVPGPGSLYILPNTIRYSSRIFCRLLFLCLFKRSIALGLGVGLGLGIGLGFVFGLGLGVGLALGLGWVGHYMLRSESARIKPSFSWRIPKKKQKTAKNSWKFPNSRYDYRSDWTSEIDRYTKPKYNRCKPLLIHTSTKYPSRVIPSELIPTCAISSEEKGWKQVCW